MVEPNLQGMVNETALVKVRPEIDIQVLSFLAESNRLRDYAEARIITTAEDLKPATNDLSIIAKVKKGMEERRREYIRPLDDHKKAINDAFKMLMLPIETADKVTREKVLAFNAEQDRIRREQEEINRLRMEAAQKDAALHNGEISEPVNLVEVITEVAKRTTTDMGSSGMRDNWKWEVVDINLVPREYLMINAGMLTPIVKASKGKIVIPGVRMFNEPILAVNAR